jgi:hypothetical protein
VQRLALPLNGFNLQKNGWRLLLRRLRRPDRQGSHFIDLACLVAHWVLWLIVPSLFFPPLLARARVLPSSA